jgi:hypothetical protein
MKCPRNGVKSIPLLSLGRDPEKRRKAYRALFKMHGILWPLFLWPINGRKLPESSLILDLDRD